MVALLSESSAEMLGGLPSELLIEFGGLLSELSAEF